jgi:Domain of unknown function (DUF4247)
VTRNRLFVIAVVLVIAAFGSLIGGVMLLHKDIRTYVADHYREYSHDAGGTRYVCEESPTSVADTLAGYQSPAARASSAGTQFLRYNDAIISVGPDGPHPCSIRVEDLSAGYSHGAFIFLGPGFYPGAPTGGAGGSSGGPGGTK